jgi:hypothetical protein
MLVTFLLDENQPPFRIIAEADLPDAPLEGEPIAMNGRTYKVLERSWRLGSTPSELGPDAPPVIQIGVGILLGQIAGPPHVTLARTMPEGVKPS